MHAEGTTTVSVCAIDPADRGRSLWNELRSTTGDVLVWSDAPEPLDPADVARLTAPIRADPVVALVRGFRAETPLDELAVLPLLPLLFPDLAAIRQPLSGPCAGRRSVLERLSLTAGPAVDLAVLVDVATGCGADAVAQVVVGPRSGSDRTLAELGPVARAAMQVLLSRAGVAGVGRPPELPPVIDPD